MATLGEHAPCPWCKTDRYVKPSGTTLRSLYCGKCRREFEAGDDGDFGYARPETTAARHEADEARRKQRGARR